MTGGVVGMTGGVVGMTGGVLGMTGGVFGMKEGSVRNDARRCSTGKDGAFESRRLNPQTSPRLTSPPLHAPKSPKLLGSKASRPNHPSLIAQSPEYHLHLLNWHHAHILAHRSLQRLKQ